MKKLLALVFLLILSCDAIAHAVFNFNGANSKLNAANNPMIILPGDSNYARIPASFLIPGYQVVNWGENALNSRNLTTGLMSVIWTKVPAVCVPMIGTNDAYGYGHLPEIQPDYSKLNIGAMIYILKGRCGRVILLSPLPTRDRVNVTPWVNASQAAAADMNVQFVMLTEAMFPPSSFADDVHLNAAGYATLQQAIIDAINTPV